MDFIPEPNFSPQNRNYRKKTWLEVEVLRERPKLPFEILGEIVVRKSEGEVWTDLEPQIRKTLFDKRMDGAWMVEKKQTNVDQLHFETTDSRGHTTNTYKYEGSVYIWKGFAFRYK